MSAQIFQALVPEPLVISDPVGDLTQGLGLEGIDTLASRPPFFYQPGFPEHSQMLRDGRERHFKRAGQGQNGQISLSETIEDLPARGVGYSAKNVCPTHGQKQENQVPGTLFMMRTILKLLLNCQHYFANNLPPAAA